MALRKTTTTLRRQIAPPSWSSYISVGGSKEAVTQKYDTATKEYWPDYSQTGLVLDVAVSVYAEDGSMEPLTARNLAEVRWYVNGTEMTTANNGKRQVGDDASWENMYSIDKSASDDTRGSLTIHRNTQPGEVLELRFEGTVVDPRTNKKLVIRPEPVRLTCAVRGEDRYNLVMADLDMYDPLRDRQTEREWCAAMGRESQWPEGELAESERYLRTYPIALLRGRAAVAEGDYTLTLLRDGEEETLTPEATLTKTSLTLDMRVIDKAEYTVVATVGGEEVARGTLAVSRIERDYSCRNERRAAIGRGAESVIEDRAIVSVGGTELKNPEAYLRIVWLTDNLQGTERQWNEGERLSIKAGDAGMGERLNISIGTEPVGVRHVLTDGEGDVLTDGEGNVLIN